MTLNAENSKIQSSYRYDDIFTEGLGMKPRSERDKRYEEKHKNERKAKNVVWGTSIPRETAEEIDAFLKKHGYTKVKLIEEGYKSLLEQAGEINTDLAKITDGYDDFFDFELRKFEEEKNNNKT